MRGQKADGWGDHSAGQLELASLESELSELFNQRLSHSAAQADHSPSEC